MKYASFILYYLVVLIIRIFAIRSLRVKEKVKGKDRALSLR